MAFSSILYNFFTNPLKRHVKKRKVVLASSLEETKKKQNLKKDWNPTHHPISVKYWIQALFRSFDIK